MSHARQRAPRPSFLDALAVYLKPRVLIVLFLGFSSGLPLALSGTTLLVWMRRPAASISAPSDCSRWSASPYTIKFLWAPLTDALDVPLLSRWLGRRRGWLVFTQMLLMAAIVFLGFANPATAPRLVALGALLVATASATQDIVVDAFRVESLPENEQAAGMASYVAAYRVGMLVSTAGALLLVSRLQAYGFAQQAAWTAGYVAMAVLVVIGIVASLVADRAGAFAAWSKPTCQPRAAKTRSRAWSRPPSARSSISSATTWRFVVLAFVVLFKFTDALAGAMTAPFVIDLGFSPQRISPRISQGRRTRGHARRRICRRLRRPRLPARRAACGSAPCCRPSTILVFSGLALVGHDILALDVFGGDLENFADALGTVIFVAYLSALCQSPLHTATQYALLTALAAVGRTYLLVRRPAIWSPRPAGFWFFVICTLRRPARACCCWPGCSGAGTSSGWSRRKLKQRPLLDRRRQRALVEIIEFAADRHAVREPRHLHVRVLQQFGDVVRGGLAVDGGVERQDHFLHLAAVRARNERVDGRDPAGRRRRAATACRRARGSGR